MRAAPPQPSLYDNIAYRILEGCLEQNTTTLQISDILQLLFAFAVLLPRMKKTQKDGRGQEETSLCLCVLCCGLRFKQHQTRLAYLGSTRTGVQTILNSLQLGA